MVGTHDESVAAKAASSNVCFMVSRTAELLEQHDDAKPYRILRL